MSIRSIQLMKK